MALQYSTARLLLGLSSSSAISDPGHSACTAACRAAAKLRAPAASCCFSAVRYASLHSTRAAFCSRAVSGVSAPKTSASHPAAARMRTPARAKASAPAQAQGAGRANTRSAPQASAACTRTASGNSGSAPRWVSPQLMATATRCAPSARACASCHAWPLWKGSYSAMMPANFMELLLFAKRLLKLYRIYRKILPFPGFVGRIYKNLVHKFYRFARVAP